MPQKVLGKYKCLICRVFPYFCKKIKENLVYVVFGFGGVTEFFLPVREIVPIDALGRSDVDGPQVLEGDPCRVRQLSSRGQRGGGRGQVPPPSRPAEGGRDHLGVDEEEGGGGGGIVVRRGVGAVATLARREQAVQLGGNITIFVLHTVHIRGKKCLEIIQTTKK